MSRTKQWALGLIGVLILIASTYFAQVYITAQRTGETPHYFAPTGNQQIGFSLILAVIAMLVGIISSYLFEKAKNTTRRTISLRVELSRMVSNPNFVMALVAAPLTFNSIYLAIGNNPQTLGDFLLAFQNGFFWESIVGALIKTREVGSDKDMEYGTTKNGFREK